MTIDEQTFIRARKLDAAAVERLLGTYYPTVHRLAWALTGREEAGRKVERTIMRRGLDRMQGWRSADQPARWFHHHTVLLTRRFASLDPTPADDVLVRTAENPSPQYVAFVRALRKLAHQPREAILLAHAEKLNPRELAVAMDCSTEAAANHLANARRELAAVVGAELNVLLAQLEQVYQRLTPDEHLALPMVKKLSRRFIWPRRLWRWIRTLITIGLLLAVAWLVWQYRSLIDW